jgi:hypothetical protein
MWQLSLVKWRDGAPFTGCGGVAQTSSPEGGRRGVIGWRHREVVDTPLAEAIAEPRCVDTLDELLHSSRLQARRGVAEPRCVDPEETLVRTARGLGISFGD